MPFTEVTITHDFDLPDGAGHRGTVEFTPVEPMRNGGRTISGTCRAELDSSGGLSQRLQATTDPGTTPPGVRYRVVVRLAGAPIQVSYVRIPHNNGPTIDLASLAGGGSTGATIATIDAGLIDTSTLG